MNIEMFLTAKEVEESLERQETATCLAWCHDNKSRLRKMKVSWVRFSPSCCIQTFTCVLTVITEPQYVLWLYSLQSVFSFQRCFVT